MKLNLSNPSGFPEFTPQQERVRQQWLSVIREVFTSHGFQPVETPLVEREENLLAKGGNAKEMYVLKRLHDEEGDSSHSGNAFRFDHTVPLALYVSRHLQDITFPFKRYAIGPVLRGERAQRYRYRQFDQCDIDIIGSGSLSIANDATCIAVMIEIFEKLNIGDFVVRINNRKSLRALLEYLNINLDSRLILAALDDLEKKGKESVLAQLISIGVSSDDAKEILRVVVETDLSIFHDMEGDNDNLPEYMNETNQLGAYLESMGVPKDRYKFDFSIVRGLDYYTGTVFETSLVGEGAVKGMSLCSGGRYDDLGEMMSGKPLPGVGASIGLTRLLQMLFDAGIVKTEDSSHLDVLVLPFSAEQTGDALSVGSELRKEGLHVDVYLEDKKIGKKFDYADKIGVQWVAVLGEKEISEGVVQLKNMKTGESEALSLAEVLKKVQ